MEVLLSNFLIENVSQYPMISQMLFGSDKSSQVSNERVKRNGEVVGVKIVAVVCCRLVIDFRDDWRRLLITVRFKKKTKISETLFFSLTLLSWAFAIHN